MNDTDSSARLSRIVVGYDGSPTAADALRRGARIAQDQHATLEVVTSWHYPMAYGGYPLTAAWAPDTDAEKILRGGLHEQFGAVVPEWVTTHIAQGNAAEVLLDESRGAEMLVVGSRGHGGFAGLLLGSVSSACAEHAKCPVLVVHPDQAPLGTERAERHDLESTLPL